MQVKTKIRKNFIFDEDVVRDLEYIAEKLNLSQTATVKWLIADKKKEYEKEKKLEYAKKLIGSSKGLYVGKSIQSIKAEMDV